MHVQPHGEVFKPMGTNERTTKEQKNQTKPKPTKPNPTNKHWLKQVLTDSLWICTPSLYQNQNNWPYTIPILMISWSKYVKVPPKLKGKKHLQKKSSLSLQTKNSKNIYTNLWQDMAGVCRWQKSIVPDCLHPATRYQPVLHLRGIH